jgi:hypothetical protein
MVRQSRAGTSAAKLAHPMSAKVAKSNFGIREMGMWDLTS